MRNRIIEQIEIVVSYLKGARNLAWGMFVLAVLGVITPWLIFGIERGCFSGGNNNGDPPLPPRPLFSTLMKDIKNEPMTDKRFEMLAANFNVVPGDLPLNELRKIIELFLPENYKLKVIELLQPKITADYSDNELETFKNLFNKYRKQKVEDLLPEREK